MNSYAECKTIVELDLDPIKVKLMHKQSGEGWTQARASAVEVEYRRFLYLKKVFPNEDITPLQDVDTFWHYHILDTMKYAKDCEQIFGEFLHHFPYSGLRGEEDLAKHQQLGDRTRALYGQVFGDDYFRKATTTAWCNVGNAEAARSAWCNATVRAAPLDGGRTAWCNTTGRTATISLDTWCNSPSTDSHADAARTAWCNTTVKASSADSVPMAWCNATVAASGTVGGRTAWCNTSAPGSSAGSARTAWCNTTVTPILPSMAWCNATGAANGATVAWCNAGITKKGTDYSLVRPQEELLSA